MNPSFGRLGLIDRIIWSMFMVWLVIDSITGFFLNQGSEVPISQLFKFSLLTLLLIRLSHVKRIVFVMTVFLIYVPIFLLNLTFINEVVGPSILLLSKCLTTILIYIYICYFKEKYDAQIYTYVINLTFKSGFFLILINILIGILGYGFYTYELMQIGYKGFFYAGNELSATVIPVFGFLLYKVYDRKHLLPYLALSVFLIIIGVSVGTKGCIIAPILLSVLIPFIYSNNLGRIKIIIYLTIVIILGGIIVERYIEGFEIDQIEKIITTYQEKGMEDTISGGRTGYWEQEKNDILGSGAVTFLFGLGGNRSVEMDPMDIFLNYGAIGVITIYLIIIFQLIYVYRTIKYNSWSKVVFTIDLILLCLSCIAGHVIFSSMAGLYIALINSLTYIPKKKNINTRQFVIQTIHN